MGRRGVSAYAECSCMAAMEEVNRRLMPLGLNGGGAEAV